MSIVNLILAMFAVIIFLSAVFTVGSFWDYESEKVANIMTTVTNPIPIGIIFGIIIIYPLINCLISSILSYKFKDKPYSYAYNFIISIGIYIIYLGYIIAVSFPSGAIKEKCNFIYSVQGMESAGYIIIGISLVLMIIITIINTKNRKRFENIEKEVKTNEQ